MTAPVHIVGGITITGIFGGFLGINILESPFYISTIVIAAQLPDIDHTKSPIGISVYPIARWINRRYGHRTITHSLAALFLLTGLVTSLSKYHTGTGIYGTIFFLAYSSHLILDMITVQGVPLFYPFAKNPCVVPGDQNMRFESGNIRTETMAFFFLLAMGVFMQPLMKTGFWTQYNRAFGTLKHLYSEFRKSEDLLEVEYFGHKGSDRVEGKGYVIESEEERAILIKENKFFNLDNKDFVIEKVIPTHTGIKYYYKNQTFININLDSLNKLCIDQLISKIEVHANNAFIPWANDFANTTTTKFKGELLSNLFFEEKTPEPNEEKTYRSTRNPRINLLKDKLSRLQKLQIQNQATNQQLKTQLEQLRKSAKEERDYLKRDGLMNQIAQLEKTPAAESYAQKIQDTKIQIQELTELDRVKNKEGLLELAEKNKLEVVEETRFTGFMTTLTIEN